MKYLSPIIGIFLSIIIFMKLLHLLNVGNTFVNVVGIVLLFLLGYVIVKTRVFTKFKNKN